MIRMIAVLAMLCAAGCATVPRPHEPPPPQAEAPPPPAEVPLPAEPPSPLEAPQPRTLGQKAAMHIYYYAPETLDITYVDTYLFPSAQKCERAIPRAGMISSPHTSHGDLLDIECVTLHPPARPKSPPPEGESTL